MRIVEKSHSKGEHAYYAFEGLRRIIGACYSRDDLLGEEKASLVVCAKTPSGSYNTWVYADKSGGRRVTFKSEKDLELLAERTSFEIAAIGSLPHERLKEMLLIGISKARDLASR